MLLKDHESVVANIFISKPNKNAFVKCISRQNKLRALQCKLWPTQTQSMYQNKAKFKSVIKPKVHHNVATKVAIVVKTTNVLLGSWNSIPKSNKNKKQNVQQWLIKH